MKVRITLLSFICIAIFAATAFSQSAAGKVVMINSLAFDDAKAGLTKYVAAMNILEKEFMPLQTELQTMSSRFDTLKREVETLSKQGAAPILQAKSEELQKLSRDISFKQEDAKARYAKRERAVLGPVMQEIAKGLQDFATAKGYGLVFDVAKDNAGLLVAVGDKTLDVTKEFITFYNARP